MNIKLSGEQKKAPVKNPDGIVPLMQQILNRENKLGRAQEHFWVVGLNSANKILYIELVALGRQNRVTANPPDVFRMGIYKLAVRVILVHNHPSGDLIASTADRAATDRLLKVGEIINIDVIDHIIISEAGHCSFEEDGILDHLRKSDTWRLVEKEELEMRKMREEVEKIRLVKDKAIEIAKKLKEGGMDDPTIRKNTGLSLREIKRL